MISDWARKYSFIAVIDKTEYGYVAQFPEIPNCTTSATKFADIELNAQTALQAYFDAAPDPIPEHFHPASNEYEQLIHSGMWIMIYATLPRKL